MKLEYQDHKISDLVKFWVDAYQTDGREIFSYEYFIDPAKDTVVIRMFLKDPK